MLTSARRSPLPGFFPSLAFTLGYLGFLLLVPLAACVVKATSLTWGEFLSAAWSERAQHAYALTFGAAATAASADVMLGLLLAWVLVRYEFPGRKILDALIDLPIALPTAVAGLVYSMLYVKSGWYGQVLVPMGLPTSPEMHSPLPIVLVLMFLGLPFTVRTIQPVLESIEGDVEEAAASLGASRLQTFFRVLLPAIRPGMMTGYALAFARGLGEYGSIIFVTSNKRYLTEIAPMLIASQLDEFNYAQATAIAVVLLVGSLLSLGLVNWLERRSRRFG